MRIPIIIKNDLKLFFSDWKAVILFFGLPIAFVSIFISSLSPLLDMNRFVDSFNIALVDKDDTVESRVLINQFISSQSAEYDIDSTRNPISFIKTDEASAMDMLNNGDVAGVIIIPEGFVYSMSIGENKPLKVITDSSRPLYALFIKNYMESYANIISAAQNGIMTAYVYYDKFVSGKEFYDEKYADVVTSFSLKALSKNDLFVNKEVSYIPNVTKYEYFTAALLVVFIMFSGIMGIKFTASEKLHGISDRLSVSPLKDAELILARFITVFILSLLQFFALIVPAGLIFKIYLNASPVYMLIMFVTTVFTVSACAIFVAVISPTPAAADLAGSLGTLLMAAIGGSIYPLTSLPDGIKSLSYLTINRWAVDGFLQIFSGQISASYYHDIGILMLMGAVYIFISIILLKLQKGNVLRIRS
ncbi:MAG TPA: ABC transporter permease [Clostridiaceae bacterium]|nr:ABC transporter permease [Clostridiaceae bacterium]